MNFYRDVVILLKNNSNIIAYSFNYIFYIKLNLFYKMASNIIMKTISGTDRMTNKNLEVDPLVYERIYLPLTQIP